MKRPFNLQDFKDGVAASTREGKTCYYVGVVETPTEFKTLVSVGLFMREYTIDDNGNAYRNRETKFDVIFMKEANED